jgi:hypothetical protein
MPQFVISNSPSVAARSGHSGRTSPQASRVTHARSLLVIDRTGNVAQQLGFAQVELAFDVTAGFVDQFAAFG